MTNNPIELRTLVREKSNSELRQTRKRSSGTDFNSNFNSKDQTDVSGPRQRPKSLAENASLNFNSKRDKDVKKAMYTSKKVEKKTGIKEWFFGKTAKTQKIKTSNVPNAEVGPIVERLQKQSAYLRATMQKDEPVRGVSPTNKARIQDTYSNYEEFRHRKHLLQIHARPTWCDVCEDFIWGIYRSAVRCQCRLFSGHLCFISFLVY